MMYQLHIATEQKVSQLFGIYGLVPKAKGRAALVVCDLKESRLVFAVDTEHESELGSAELDFCPSAMVMRSGKVICEWRGRPQRFWSAVSEIDRMLKKFNRAMEVLPETDAAFELITGVMAGLGVPRV